MMSAERLTLDASELAGDYQLRTRLIHGPGVLSQLGELARSLGARRALLVTDPGIVAAGHAGRGHAYLENAGLDVLLFAGARENPTTADVERGVESAAGFAPDLIVGLGGGSSMDCAKGINFILTNGGQMRDYWGVDKATRPMLPLIAVPTTSGTGSEMQSFALISDAETHVKIACGVKNTCAKIAVLDPELTVTQPPSVTALTGIDALSHAIETFVSTKKTLLSRMYSREAFRLLSHSFEMVLQEPTNLSARSAMQMGACLAGMAIESSMLGAAHALANPLTAKFGTAHGQAVGLMLPHVVRYNAEQFEPEYQLLMQSFAAPQRRRASEHPNKPSGSAELADWLVSVLRLAGLATELRGLHVTADHVSDLAAAAAPQWTGTFNPRKVDAEVLGRLYHRAL
ncbi:MAG: iron-containing alcohol dehydrogenase [Planctomycetaceae bacterium]|nr:iron-containing alcohol dehydrogenase [Planctomycetaceae bacterium]